MSVVQNGILYLSTHLMLSAVNADRLHYWLQFLLTTSEHVPVSLTLLSDFILPANFPQLL